MADLDNSGTPTLDTLKQYLKQLETKQQQIYQTLTQKAEEWKGFGNELYYASLCTRDTLQQKLQDGGNAFMKAHKTRFDLIPIQIRVSSLFLATGYVFVKTPGYFMKFRQAFWVGCIWAFVFTPELFNPFSKE